MQIILMEKVHNLGQLGDVVKVKDGFARNFLIPQGKARRATEKAIEEFKARRAELEAAHNKALTLAQERAGRLEGLMVQITQKAGVDGRLFGSVTNYDIAESLKAQGHEVTKAMVRLAPKRVGVAAPRAELIRLPPLWGGAERSWLGGLLLENPAGDKTADMTGEWVFSRPAPGLLPRPVPKLVGNSRPADVITVS